MNGDINSEMAITWWRTRPASCDSCLASLTTISSIFVIELKLNKPTASLERH